MDQLIFNELKIIKNQLTALTCMVTIKEAHEMGIYDDETYKGVIQETLSKLDDIVAKYY